MLEELTKELIANIRSKLQSATSEMERSKLASELLSLEERMKFQNKFSLITYHLFV